VGKTLVTGGTGFLGSHLVRALAERGDELRLLVRETSRTDHLDPISYERAVGEVTDVDSVAAAMAGVERVFHVAGRTSLRRSDAERVREVNVTGTRTVLGEALRAGVERVVHTSSVAALGPATRDRPADETQGYTGARLGNAYVDSKHEAEEEARRLAGEGLPVVIANPTFVLGPDDPYGTSMALVRRFLLRRIPGYVNGGLNIVDVRDVAAGHLLVETKGQVGERYILAGRNFTLQRLFADLSRISGVPPPPIRIPGAAALAGVGLAERIGLPLPVSAEEVSSARLWWWYRGDRAREELGFAPRPHEQTLEDAVRWQADQLGDRVGEGAGPLDLPLRIAGRAMAIGERILGR